jgi:hypothetical protein
MTVQLLRCALWFGATKSFPSHLFSHRRLIEDWLRRVAGITELLSRANAIVSHDKFGLRASAFPASQRINACPVFPIPRAGRAAHNTAVRNNCLSKAPTIEDTYAPQNCSSCCTFHFHHNVGCHGAHLCFKSAMADEAYSGGLTVGPGSPNLGL